MIYLGQKGAWWSDLAVKTEAGPESFVLKMQKDAAGRQALVGTGSDLRGAIYAVYTFSEEILGVDPWYFWVDKEPAYRGKIEVHAGYSKAFGPPTFRYRGWFINDEDLLSEYAREPLRENVFFVGNFRSNLRNAVAAAGKRDYTRYVQFPPMSVATNWPPAADWRSTCTTFRWWG